jgi:hypothetical protein
MADIDNIEGGIRTEYWGAPAFYNDRERHIDAWQRNLPDLSAHAAVGRLIIEDDLLERAKWEVNTYPTTKLMGFGQLERAATDEELTPFLGTFLRTCRQRFEQIIQLDAQHFYPTSNTFGEGNVYFGRYSPELTSSWHADTTVITHADMDNADINRDLTYTVTVLGQPTAYSASQQRRQDFTQAGFLREPPEGISWYMPRVVAVHDDMTAHAAPSSEYEGNPRHFMNYRQDHVF